MKNKVTVKNKLKITPFFKWFDIWIGIFIDTIHKAVYICPLPMLGVKIQLLEISVCPKCDLPLQKSAHNTGDGWALFWECSGYSCWDLDIEQFEIEWPFEEWMTGKDLEKFGYTIV